MFLNTDINSRAAVVILMLYPDYQMLFLFLQYGTKTNPGMSCEDILKKTCMETPEDGIYWIAFIKGKINES